MWDDLLERASGRRASLRLPPLNALRAFEAVARLGGVKYAAQELSVTPAAVSQQVRLLEDHVGQRLFTRLPRELRLTDAGLEYQRAVTRHLRGIAEATARLRPRPSGVAITVVPSFATLWLAPRLPQFVRQHPEIEIRVEADPQLVDFHSSRFDLAIREGTGRYRDTEVAALFAVELLPVASPGYLATLREGSDIAWSRARLLYEESSENWEHWFERRGVRFAADRAVFFSHGMMALAAAAEGEGVALASFCLVEQAIRSGRLAVVEPMSLATGMQYWLAWPSAELRRIGDPSRLFRDWLIAQAAQTSESGRAVLPPEPA